MCACRPCQLRRRTCVIVLRSRDGKDVRRLPWDGLAKEVSFTAAEDTEVRHCLWVAADGEVLIAVPAAHTIRAGDRIAIQLNPAAAGAACIEVWGPSPLTRLLDDLTRRIAAAYAVPETILLGHAPRDPAREATKPMDFFYDRIRYAQTAAGIRTAALMLPNVLDVEVSSPTPGEVLVAVTEWEGDRCMHIEDFMLLRQVLTPQLAIGMKLDIVDRTPQAVLDDVMTRTKKGITVFGYTLGNFNELNWYILNFITKRLGEEVGETAVIDEDPKLGRLHVRLTYRGKVYGYSVELPSAPHGTCIGS